jgi:hypothetical protein
MNERQDDRPDHREEGIRRPERWSRPLDPREIHRREIGEQQRRNVKRRKRKPKGTLTRKPGSTS